MSGEAIGINRKNPEHNYESIDDRRRFDARRIIRHKAQRPLLHRHNRQQARRAWE